MRQVKTTILIVDDHPMLRDGVRQVVERTDRFTVVGEAGTGGEALRLVERLGPDIVLLDICLPDVNGSVVLREMLEVESLGPLVTLKPGATVRHTEIWELFRKVPRVRTETDADRYIRPLAE